MQESLQGFAVVARENHGHQELHKLSNIQKTVRLRSPEGGFQRIVHDIADEIKPGIRFQSRAFAALQEALKSFTTSYFTAMRLNANYANRVTIRLEDSNLVKDMLRIWYPSHPLAKKK
ncbi:histone H3.4 [Trichoderma asperellum]|uniref:Histone H3.4 n=1 Tax=Trichoderma asperellum TaxID=101201 RepID=A0A6V8QT27_TRIAP|nr:hypothetical protein LI328DRAFT_161787 [Trichoderma asperelloides]GFP54966.1 histone H3.4 [Trichoderma asperellum]